MKIGAMNITEARKLQEIITEWPAIKARLAALEAPPPKPVAAILRPDWSPLPVDPVVVQIVKRKPGRPRKAA